MNWDDVKNVLTSAGLDGDWLTKLESFEDGERLGLCMAIDIVSGAVEAKTFAKIVKHIEGKGDIREAFGKIVNTPPTCDDYICSSILPHVPLADYDTYVRVVELGDFIKFYINRGYTRAPSHVKRIRRMYFQPRDDKELSRVRRWVRGRLPNVWVTSFEDLQELLRGKDETQRGRVVYESLGLGFTTGVGADNNPELVAIKYPGGFDKVLACTQPTTLDAWWVNSGWNFLAYRRNDSWGRTYSLTSEGKRQRERVHSLFKNLTAGYRTYYIGVARYVEANRDDLLRDGYSRFEKALGAV